MLAANCCKKRFDVNDEKRMTCHELIVLSACFNIYVYFFEREGRPKRYNSLCV